MYLSYTFIIHVDLASQPTLKGGWERMNVVRYWLTLQHSFAPRRIPPWKEGREGGAFVYGKGKGKGKEKGKRKGKGKEKGKGKGNGKAGE